MSSREHEVDQSNEGLAGIGCVVAIVGFGAIFVAALVALWADKDPPPMPAPAPAVEAPAAEPAVEVPEGAGVTASMRDGLPMLAVYFDSGSTEVAGDFDGVSADVIAYLEANPDAKVAISGFNDPTGDAELNAELSKTRAQNVQAALVAKGVAEDRTDLVKPDDTTREELSNAEARRVEITIVK